MFYGQAGKAKSSARKLAKSLVQTRDFNTFASPDLLDTASTDGTILVNSEFSISDRNNFHCYALAIALAAAIPREELHAFMRDWILWSLEEEWRFVLAIGRDSVVGLMRREPAVLRRYIDASARHWSVLKAEGKRFGPSSNGEVEIWEVWSNAGFALASLGAPQPKLKGMLAAGPSEFLPYAAESPISP